MLIAALETPSNAGWPGAFGWRCLSRIAASLASRPACRVAQGTGQSPASTRRSPFLWLLSFGEAKESTPAGKAERSGRISPKPNSQQSKNSGDKQQCPSPP
ncbi:MAG: hypothetical protein E6Q42_14505 [Dechloromonas sp.]|nr:MAG: hypothetical protein E6Q42_14505 [Dechloromonas sp.]